MTPDAFRAAAQDAGIAVSRETLDRLAAHVALVADWQSRMNLIAPSTLPGIWHRHVLDSAQLYPLIPEEARRIADIGSGAGFPGLTLAILLSGAGRPARVTLFESIAKKARFLEAAIAATGAPARARNQRVEASDMGAMDVIVARAVAPLARFLPLVERVIGPQTRLILHQGRSIEAQLTAAAKDWRFEVDIAPSCTGPDSAIAILTETARVRQPRRSHDRRRP